MKLFGPEWTNPDETYDVRCSRQTKSGKWFYPPIAADDLAISLLLMHYNLPPTQPLPWWIIDFSGHMQRFAGFGPARLQLKAGTVPDGYYWRTYRLQDPYRTAVRELNKIIYPPITGGILA